MARGQRLFIENVETRVSRLSLPLNFRFASETDRQRPQRCLS
jgi:hypothetical protein